MFYKKTYQFVPYLHAAQLVGIVFLITNQIFANMRSLFLNIPLIFCLLFCSISIFSCKKRMPIIVNKSGDFQVIPILAKLPEPLQVEVLNDKNEPIQCLPVTFFVKNGSGYFDGGVYEVKDTTDENGIASVQYYFGVENTDQQVIARIKRFDEDVTFTASPEYVTDNRDLERYLLVQVGNTTWTAQNMRFSTTGSLENPNNPSSLYGRLYTWQTAQNVCPAGFHLPNDSLFTDLITTLGNEYNAIGYKLKSRTGWLNDKIGKNLSGFNLYPAGNYLSSIGNYRGLSEYGVFWTSDEADPNNGIYRILGWDSDDFYGANYLKSTYSSCRCVRD